MTTKRKPGRKPTGRFREPTSVVLSADEKTRLLRWGRSVSAAVRAVLAVADAARDTPEDAARLACVLTESRAVVP
jgi:hypothetical protein